MENIEPFPSSTQQQTDVGKLGGRPLQPAMETADSSVGEQLKSIDEQKRIAQLEHEIFTVCKQLDEKSEKFKDVQDQNALLKDRLGTLEQEKLDAARFTESLVKSRDSLIQEKTELQNDRLCLEKRKDELELQVSKLTNEKRRHLDDICLLRNKCDQLFGEREQKINELRFQMLKEQSEMQRELSLFDERTTELTAKAEQLQENLLERENEFPTINEPPPGIPTRPFFSPDIDHHPVAAAAVGAHIAAPPGFRAPPGFDTTTYKSGSSTCKSDISSNKFDITEALKEAFNTENTDCRNSTVPQPLSALSPRSQNIQEAQNARLPMSSSFSSNENLHSIRESSPPPVSHTVVPASSPLAAAFASFSHAQYYQLAGAEVFDFEQVQQQMENRANEILTMVDGQLSPDRSLYQRFANLGAVLHALQRLHRLHPDGFTVEQYVQFENRQKRGRPTQEGFFFNNIMPTVVSLLESDDDLLRVDRKNGIFYVSEEVAQTRLFCLGKNLCSNLFRLLRRYSNNAIRIQSLIDIAPKLVPKGAPAPDTNALLALCNCHPTIFKLCCSPQDNYRFDTAWIMLNDLLLSSENLTWRVVLDTDDI
uniref:Uncharacterized protein n=1 Tax=Globodera rostochiensis TaxID=31243 RepID=A0A914I3R0_GLORO